MKNRNGFVSNSSSSSFICQVSGTESIAESLYEADMFVCENEHTFLGKYLVDKDQYSVVYDHERYDINPENCPLCRFKKIPSKLMFEYLLMKNGITENDLITEIKTKFKNYDDLMKYMKEI